MSAAAERRVDVRAVGSNRQGGDGFLEQDGNVVTAGHQRLKPSSSGGKPPEGNVIVRAVASCHFVSSQSSNLLPWPDEHDVMVELGVLAKRRRNQDASRGVHLDVVGVTDEQPLQARGSRR